MVQMVSVNFVTFVFFADFSAGSFENVAGIDDFSVVPLAAAKQSIFNHNVRFSYYQLISGHFGENRVILLQTVAK